MITFCFPEERKKSLFMLSHKFDLHCHKESVKYLSWMSKTLIYEFLTRTIHADYQPTDSKTS